MKSTKDQRAQLRRESRTWPEVLTVVPKENWKPVAWDDQCRISVLRSRHFLVQVVAEKDGAIRLTVNRTDQDKNGEWIGDITWDELMQVKREAGFGSQMAVEFYPADADVVNVANLRHLFIPVGGKLPTHWTKNTCHTTILQPS